MTDPTQAPSKDLLAQIEHWANQIPEAGPIRALLARRPAHEPRADAEALAAVPDLKGKRALVLYFPTDADRDEFVALIHEAKPGMRTVKL